MRQRTFDAVYDATNDVWIVDPPRNTGYSLEAFLDDVGTLAAMAALGAVSYFVLMF